MRKNLDYIMLHVGANELKSDISFEKLPESVDNVATTLISDLRNVTFSNITMIISKHQKKGVK